MKKSHLAVVIAALMVAGCAQELPDTFYMDMSGKADGEPLNCPIRDLCADSIGRTGQRLISMDSAKCGARLPERPAPALTGAGFFILTPA